MSAGSIRGNEACGRRAGLVWLVSLPLMVLGSETAHVVAYRLVYPNPLERAQVLASTGHGYFAYAPLLLALAFAVLACGFFAQVFRADPATRTAPLRLPAGAFAALPPATFVLQEHLERLVHGGALPFGAALEPTFLIGLALQMPFALIVYAVARLLLRAAEKLGVLLRSRPPRHRASVPVQRWRSDGLALPRPAPLVGGSSGRGPPVRLRAAHPRVRLLRRALSSTG